MANKDFSTIDRRELEQRLERKKPDNENRSAGYTLVNVLDPDAFAKEHIRGSINIPQSEIDQFEERFDKDKVIILYCASTDCDASLNTATELADRGFTNVLDYEAGMADWKQAGNAVGGREAA